MNGGFFMSSSINFVNAAYQRYTQMANTKTTTVDSTKSFSTVKSYAVNRKNNMASNEKSAVAKYKKSHPESRHIVDSQVNAGRAVLEKNGATNVSRQDMTMEEYKQFITNLMNSIPFDATQSNNVEIWSISEEGWEQMKKDSDYEAWVLGYTSQNRAVRNPFAGLMGNMGNFCTEKFGASIDEHIGQSVSMSTMNGNTSAKNKNKKSWWQERNERYEEMVEEWTKAVQLRHQVLRAKMMEQYEFELQEQGLQKLGSFQMTNPISIDNLKWKTSKALQNYNFF